MDFWLSMEDNHSAEDKTGFRLWKLSWMLSTLGATYVAP